MFGRAPCLDGLRNRRIAAAQVPSLGTEGSAGICAGRPDVCQTGSAAFRAVDRSPRLMPYKRPLRGAGSLKRRENVWVDSCLRSAPPRMGSISHTLSRPLSLRSLSRCPACAACTELVEVACRSKPAEGLSKGRRVGEGRRPGTAARAFRHFDKLNAGKLNERAAKMRVQEARKMSVFCHSRLYIN